ncbi:sodium:proton antiporter NhaD [Lentisphaera marina]|uniref:sodium:proton antiporter NhaD n=1 Tax=Lentisphaera marina TaxID=1111041 RepID=UPI0023651509|nr:sodium:proton antiporter NhaD [Lentisphaera marina]MDD7986290.1 sodium:proton antiporter NhaD [Lentisphaera marina]
MIDSFLLASSSGLNATDHPLGYLALAVFVLSYACVIFEEMLHMKKSKPVMLAAGLIWIIVGMIIYTKTDDTPIKKEAVEHVQLIDSNNTEQSQSAPSVIDEESKNLDEVNVDGHGEEVIKTEREEAFHHYNLEIKHLLIEFAELFFFLFVAMTFILTMEERGVFRVLRAYLVGKGYSFRQLFWITGIISFFLSPIADNLTTALIMGTVVSRMADGNKKFLIPAFVNIVVASNSGGAFSPFGDITTLMVWQAGKVTFFEFFALFFPAVVNFIIPAAILYFFVPNEKPHPLKEEVKVYYGAKTVSLLFLVTVALSVTLHNLFHMPPFLGMMTGMSFLLIYNYTQIVRNREKHNGQPEINVFKYIEKTEFDTLFFFFGVIFCIGGLAYIGYIDKLASVMYAAEDKTMANVIAGLLSAVIDNIPMMFGVLKMDPTMSHYQWLMITLTAGVGGSVLALGSAAGVGLMGVARGEYTFMAHLKYSWVILIGYVAAVYSHYLINYPG